MADEKRVTETETKTKNDMFGDPKETKTTTKVEVKKGQDVKVTGCVEAGAGSGYVHALTPPLVAKAPAGPAARARSAAAAAGSDASSRVPSRDR